MTPCFRRVAPLLIAGLVLTGALAEAKPKKVTVTVADFTFAPKFIVLAVGDTVEWKNVGAVVHTATSGDGLDDPNAGILFDSGVLSPGGTYRHIFTGVGKFPYFCQPHDFLGMKGAVSVVSPAHKRVDVQVNDNLTTQAFFFSPSTVTVAPGDTIRWTNVGHTIHTVTSGTYGNPNEGVLFDSGALDVGGVFTWVATDTTGSLPYHCIPHAELGMVGTINFQATGIEEHAGPSVFEARAFPNPSRDGVSLSFLLPRAGAVVVEVLDAQGRVVSDLFRGTAAAGPQRFAWSGTRGDGQRLPVGQYFYRVTGAEGVATGRLTRVH